MVDIWIMAPSLTRRNWLSRSAATDNTIRVAGTSATFPFLRSLISETSADVAVVDLEAGADTQIVREWLSELLELVTVLLICSAADQAIFNRILNQKAGGILSVDVSPEQFVQAIKSVVSGLLVFDGSVLHHAVHSSDETTLAEPLTARESEVLGLLANGLGNREIAATLNISEHTIKFHIRSILGKLGASTRTEAVTRGLRSGLIEL